MASFTPGPWRWCGHYLMQDCQRDDGKGKEDNPYATPCGHPIADDGSAGDEYSPAIDTNGPDAHLMAASPEMHEALETSNRTLQTLLKLHAPHQFEIEAAILKNTAALAKAEGHSAA